MSLTFALAFSIAAAATDPQTAELRGHMERYYAAARVVLKDAQSCLEADQRAWQRRLEACKDADCANDAYLDRLAELDGLQPGATAIKGRELPARPTLSWIVPPAADKVAAPPNPKARPWTASGAIVEEVASGDGFVLRTDGGERYLIVMNMLLEGETASRLQALSRDLDGHFTARGHVSAPGGKAFEPSRCVFLHRVGFKPHQLPFALPRDGVARAEHRSPPFHAVILRTAAKCSISEDERLEAQRLFPSNKVFSTRFGCEDEETITYGNVDPQWGFLAVHAGAGMAEARKLLERVKATGKFPGANIRRMEAVLVYP